MRPALLLLAFASAVDAAWGAGRLSAAIDLYNSHNYRDAEFILRQIVASDPKNAGACYYLGMTLRGRSLDEALPWLQKATVLAPGNERYLADYAGTSLELADRDTSFTLALQGRDAMEKAVAMNPGDLHAREGLMRFFADAPWPLGDPDRARTQANEILSRDPARGRRALLLLARDFAKHGRGAESREVYAEILNLEPANAEAQSALALPK